MIYYIKWKIMMVGLFSPFTRKVNILIEYVPSATGCVTIEVYGADSINTEV